MKLYKCDKHNQDLFYLWDSPHGLIPQCQMCFDESVEKADIIFKIPETVNNKLTAGKTKT